MEVNDYYLYFLDEEFLTILGLDKIAQIYDIIVSNIRYILFSSYGKLYLPLSAAIECEYADRFIKENRDLFKKRFFITMSDKSLEDYLYYKQEQYAHNAEMLKKYQSYRYEHLIDLPYRTKYTDTTSYIEYGMVEKLTVNRKMLHNVDYYIEKIKERKKAAITHHLFEEIYAVKGVERRQQKEINDAITELFITTYMEDFGGDIAIPYQVGLRAYSNLSKTFPINDMTLWYSIYDKIGCNLFIEKCDQLTMIEVFEDNIFLKFINTIYQLVNSIKGKNILKFQRMINTIPKMPDIKEFSVESFLKRLEDVSKILVENFNEVFSDEIKKVGGCKKMNVERRVFVVHGRNKRYKKSIFEFLKSLDLYPLEWERAVELTGKGAPETLEVVKKGIDSSDGVVILYTGDEQAQLVTELAKPNEKVEKVLQPRQNVVFEAGYAMAVLPNKTIIVKIGKVDISSDLKGLNYIELDDSKESRRNFMNRLKTIGLAVDDYTGDWETAGDFTV